MQLALYAPAAEVRKCSKCGEQREWDGGKGWHRRQCPECQLEYRRQRYAANADAMRERSRQYRAANPDAVREGNRRYQAANRDALREYLRQYRAVNPDAFRGYYRRYRAANPEVRRKVARNRRARKANAVCPHGRGCFHQAIGFLPQRCAVPGCRKRKGLEADHIVPLSGGGLDCRDNLQLLCRHHNRSKGTAAQTAWAQRNGRLL